MKTIHTDRLILRPFTMEDAEDVFTFNSHPDVVRYTGEDVLTSIEQAKDIIENVWYSDYKKHGYGRHAVVHKEDNKVIGFSGLKYEPDLKGTDIGYRFLPEYWGKGIATESSIAVLRWGFQELELEEILGLAYPENGASCHVLQKIGLQFYKTEPFPGEVRDCNWYRRRRTSYLDEHK